MLTTASVFIKPMMNATGWSTTEVLITPLVVLLGGLLGPIAGRIVDAGRTRTVLLTGLVCHIMLMIAFATVPLNKVTFYALAVLIGAAFSFAGNVPFTHAVAVWFDKGAGKAFGFMGVGQAIMPLVAVPLITWAIYAHGWQAGYLVLGAFTLVIALPSVLLGIKVPAVLREIVTDTAKRQGAAKPVKTNVRGVFRTLRFWLFAIATGCTYGGVAAYTANLQPILLDGGLTLTVATTITTLSAAASTLGRLTAGILLDLINRYLVVITLMSLALLGALLLANASALPVVVVAIAVFLIIACQGAEGDILAFFMLKEYGRLRYGTIFATVGLTSAVISAVLPYAFAGVRDSTGSYSIASYVGASMFAIAVTCVALFGILGRRNTGKEVIEAGEVIGDQPATATN
ncbi:MFS transporter [Streptomyces sp. CA-100214]